MLVLGLLFSFVQAQDKDMDKDEARAVKAKSAEKEKGKSAGKGSVGTAGPNSSSRIQDAGKDLGNVSSDKGSDKKNQKGVTSEAPNKGHSRLSGDSRMAGTKSSSASRKPGKKGGLGGFFSRMFGGAEKVDGGKSGAVQPKGDGQDRPSGGQGQQPKGNKGAPGPKSQDDGGGR